MKAHEHRTVGDEATGGALVDLAGGLSTERVLLGHGDVIALSGDFFLAEPRVPGAGLFELAGVPGDCGTVPRTRDEIVCALKVMAVDEGVPDPRFEDGGEFAAFRFSPTAARTDVERRVRDRFLSLAAANANHFVTPRGKAGGRDSAVDEYRRLHQAALDHACRLGRLGGDIAGAMAREAAAQHYLTDAFASGHVRTPIASIRQFWHDRYPRFWESLKRKIATDTAAALRELARPLRVLPANLLYDRTLAAVEARTRDYPAISLGDLLARVFHDWDNDHGLVLETGEMLFGDGHLEEGAGKQLAVAAVRAGNDDIEIAFGLGASGSRLSGEPLYQAVREATGVEPFRFLAERYLPRLSPQNPPLNWRATDVDELWDSPIVGSSETTVGQAVAEVLEPGGEVSRRLDCLGQGVVEAFDVVDIPVLRGWLGRKACQAYHFGFIEELARDPRGSVGAVVRGAGAPPPSARVEGQAVLPPHPGVPAPPTKTPAGTIGDPGWI